ncbi:MAG: hypothetical protein WA857_07500, partial [Candidatus Acidiferrum sp.]
SAAGEDTEGEFDGGVLGTVKSLKLKVERTKRKDNAETQSTQRKRREEGRRARRDLRTNWISAQKRFRVRE